MALTRTVWEISAPGSGHVARETIPAPASGEVLVQAEWGAVSSGSEGLVFAGRVPSGMALDDTVSSVGRETAYPLRYGYMLSGRVSFCGADVDTETWLGRRVFVLHPHATHAVVAVSDLLPIPDAIPSDHAPLYANAETAVTLHWDAGVLPGETVLIVGAGIVGLLTAAIAAQRCAGLVAVVDVDERRREWARQYLGEDVVVCSSIEEAVARVRESPVAARGRYDGFDVAFELTGVPAVLDPVVASVAFAGRVVVGSWYGAGTVPLTLGGRFHRSRIRLISSQVSTLPPAMAGRVDFARRSRIVWALMEHLRVASIPRRMIAFSSLPELFSGVYGGEKTEPWVIVRYGAEPMRDTT